MRGRSVRGGTGRVAPGATAPGARQRQGSRIAGPCRRAARAATVAVLAFGAPGVGAQPAREVVAELFGGTAWSLPLPLVVRAPEGEVRWRARFRTRPLADAPYYSYRLGVAGARGPAVEAEMLHHKLYLADPRPPVEHFELTHGYNLPTANVAGAGDGWRLRVGLGVVVAHPEGRIGGRRIASGRTRLGGGYQIAGVTGQLAVGRRYALARGRLAPTATPEAKLTASWARVRLGPGTALVPNAAVHLLGGLGVRRRW